MNADDRADAPHARPDHKRPPEKQDKRSVVPLAPEAWDQWLNGTGDEATAALRLPQLEAYKHGPADPTTVHTLNFEFER